MSNRKQRRRRAKAFRHEQVWVEYDEEGNEVEVSPEDIPGKKERRDKQEKAVATKPTDKGKASPAAGRGRAGRIPPPPSWRRSVRRGSIWGGIVLVTVVFLFQDMPLAARLAWGLLYALLFIPLTYWVDRMVYRGHLRREAKARERRT
jgi:hypothetical protein